MGRATACLLALAAAVLALAAAMPWTPEAGAWKKGINSDAWTKGATLYVFVSSPPSQEISDAVDSVIAAWNSAQAEFGGLTLVRDTDKTKTHIWIAWRAEIISWGATSRKGRFVDFEQDIVKIEIKTAEGINANGIRAVLMHELGHAQGLGHSADSELMKENPCAEDNYRPKASELNACGASIAPTSDDKAGTKSLWGTGKKRSKSNTYQIPQNVGGVWRYRYTVTAETDSDCEGGLCTDKITGFTVEVADAALEDAEVTPPSPEWSCQLIDARMAPSGETGRLPVDTLPRGSSLANCWTSESFGIAPGGSAEFVIETSVPPGTVRTYTSSPSFDSDESFVIGPNPEYPVGGIGEPPAPEANAAAEGSGSSGPSYAVLAGAAAAVALLVAGGAWYARRRWLR